MRGFGICMYIQCTVFAKKDKFKEICLMNSIMLTALASYYYSFFIIFT